MWTKGADDGQGPQAGRFGRCGFRSAVQPVSGVPGFVKYWKITYEAVWRNGFRHPGDHAESRYPESLAQMGASPYFG